MADGLQGFAEAASQGRKLTGAPVPPSASGVLVVDLDALAGNYAKLRAAAMPAECAAVVKGDGYGLGAAQVAAALANAGCRTFFVATLGEGMALRRDLPELPIYILDGLFPGSAETFAASGLRPVLGSLAEIEEWGRFCRTAGTPLPAAIHIDTGMNRLGLKPADHQALTAKPDLLAPFPVALVMSHLACADTPEHRKNAEQRERFAAAAKQFPGVPLSLANSAGTLLGGDLSFDLTRPGIALYGGNPFAGHPNPMSPVVTLHGRIAQIGEADAGETIGYGAALRLKRRTRFVTVATGYADGYFRLLGSSDMHSGAVAYIGEHKLPILGRVSMDLVMFDATDLPRGRAERGSFVELIGSRFTVDHAAALAGTIGYEILTSLGPRYHRLYVGGDGETSGTSGAA